MRRSFFARHGGSDYSVRNLLNGDAAATVGLTETGAAPAAPPAQGVRAEPLALCITSQLERTRLTADLALADRDVPRLVLGELNDPQYGPYEGKTIEEYRGWASGAPSSAVPGPGGESRYAIVERYVGA